MGAVQGKSPWSQRVKPLTRNSAPFQPAECLEWNLLTSFLRNPGERLLCSALLCSAQLDPELHPLQ